MAIKIVVKTQRRTTKDRTQEAYVFKKRSLKEKSLQIRPRRNRGGKTMVLIVKEKEVIQRCHCHKEHHITTGKVVVLPSSAN